MEDNNRESWASDKKVKDFFKSHGLKIMDFTEFNSTNSYVDCITEEGYKVRTCINDLKNGSKPNILYKKFAVHNINLYCKLNRPNYMFVDDEYRGHKKKHKFRFIGDEEALPEGIDRDFIISFSAFYNLNRGHQSINRSAGEQKVEKYLNDNGLNFIAEYSFSDLKDKSYLYFDFAVFDDNKELLCLIEYDGACHFYPYDRYGGQEALEYTKNHDEMKNKYCKENNIILHRIKYDEFNNINNKLDEIFNSH